MADNMVNTMGLCHFSSIVYATVIDNQPLDLIKSRNFTG
ncbi:hypothetical protein CPter291_0851 [Collimonas pratensis]|uniref:Uncharacterized protein n=1 Tax=Collimonas pratensis TaxID=279113 RepID=A0A127PZV5_9BURK|nr:hypothetical protein CPter91_0931 [Collimonas pratensis]AMP13130.1 hypothetical protein CPter291_0851 [Collimonas pratensis]